MTHDDVTAEPAPVPSDCLFCKIVAGDVPAEIVATDERAVAFRDIAPQAPMHVLVVPRDHHGDIAQLAAADPELLGAVVALADRVAGEQADGQFRLVFNSGPHAGQSVFHVHGHVIGGTQLGWTPA
jgi:histidine triad (HIT) family protein